MSFPVEVAADEIIQTEAALYPFQMPISIVLFTAMGLLLAGCIWVIFKKQKTTKELSDFFQLNQMAISIKAAISLTWLAYGLVHIFAMATVYLKTNVANPSTAEYFFYMPAHKLMALSHAHFFGHATMYVVLTFVFVWTPIKEKWKRIAILLAPVGAILDNISWWGIKMASPHFELVSMVSGAMISLGFSIMALSTFYYIWFAKAPES